MNRTATRLLAILRGSHPTVNLILIMAIVVLANLVSGNAFFRADLTGSGAYRLSPVTRETLSRLEDPLRIEVFYSAQVPAPYNRVRQYVLDLLREYAAVDPRRITVEVRDPASPEGRQAAAQYGLQQIEIQEIRSDEFQSRAAFLGVAVLYGSTVEVVDRIDSTEGLEYRLTTAIREAVLATDALAGITGSVGVTAAVSPHLAELEIEGFDTLPADLEALFHRINADSFQRLTWELRQPLPREVQATAGDLGMEPLRWRTPTGEEREGLLEIALTHGDQRRHVPIQVYSDFFGGFSLDDPRQMEDDVRQALRSLVAANPMVGYLTGAGERPLWEFNRGGAGPFAQLLEERYQVVQIDPADDAIPPGIDLLIINGPRERYSEKALYRLDQFLMGGGSLLVLADRFREEIPTQQQMMFGAQPEWFPVETRLEELLAHYGIVITDQFVLDEESFVARTPSGQQTVFQAPLLAGESFNRTSVITAALEEMILFNMAELEDRAPPGVVVTPLLRTSRRSWTVPFPQDIGPWTTGAPAGETTAERLVAALAEGTFTSFFDAPPADSPGGQGTEGPAERFRRESTGGGRVLVVSSSELASPQLLDARTRTPNGVFLMNAVDVLKGASGFAELRSKGLGVPRLEITSPLVPGIARWVNVVMVPAVVVLLGVVVWLRRRARQARIRDLFGGGAP